MYSISQAVAIAPKAHYLENPESSIEFPSRQRDISANVPVILKTKVQRSEDSLL